MAVESKRRMLVDNIGTLLGCNNIGLTAYFSLCSNLIKAL